VVITIIGILVTLVITGVQVARRAAMRAKCADYQKQVGQALLHYESNKGCFPGYITTLLYNTAKAKRVSWVVMILEYLDRKDIYEQWTAAAAAPAGVRVPTVVCPVDSDALVEAAPLSYLVNVNIFRERTDPKNPAAIITRTDMKAGQLTPMVSERVYVAATRKVGPWNDVTATTPNSPQDRFTFNWPGPAPPLPDSPPPTSLTAIPLSSGHGNGAHITFCDGHTEFISDSDERIPQYIKGPPK